ncbi:MAG: hypothetical protein JW959_12185 [Pirellulales bacterium]|nr:hypothetical protein [Pirellulales bacterium]
MLELVLALPILLMIMALMVNFGAVASWKIRGLSVSRFEAWRARHERSAYNYPPDEAWWPAAANRGHVAAGNIEVSASLTGAVDPRSLAPSGHVVVNEELFDVARGLVRGYATLDRGYAMLGGMGRYRITANTYLIDDKWQYHEMGIANNNDRRSTIIYDLPTADSASYVQCATDLFYKYYYNRPWADRLAPLHEYYLSAFAGRIIEDGYLYFGRGGPDFHPGLGGFCSLDTAVVDRLVYGRGDDPGLIDRIEGNEERRAEGVAERVARAFVGLYESVIGEYETLLDAEPPPSAAQQAAMRAVINRLQPKIDKLNRFLQTLEDDD